LQSRETIRIKQLIRNQHLTNGIRARSRHVAIEVEARTDDSFATRFSNSRKTRGNGSERSGNLHSQTGNDAVMRMRTRC